MLTSGKVLKGSLHRRVLTKEDIGQPSNFRHIAHNGKILIDENTNAQADTAQDQQPIDDDIDSENVLNKTILPPTSVLVHTPKPFLKRAAPLPPTTNQTNTSLPNKTPDVPHSLNKGSNNLSGDQIPKLTPNRRAPPPPRPPQPKFPEIQAPHSAAKTDVNNTTQTVSNILKMTAVAAFTFINNNPDGDAEVNNSETSNDQSGVTSSDNNTSESTHSVHADSGHEYIQLDQAIASCSDCPTETESSGTRQSEEKMASEGLGVLEDLDAFLLRNSVGDDLNDRETDTNTTPEYLSLIDPHNDLCTVFQPEDNEGTDSGGTQDSAGTEELSTNTQNVKQVECKKQLIPPDVLPRFVTKNGTTPCSQESPGMVSLCEIVSSLVIEKSSETDVTISSDSNNVIHNLENTKSEDFEFPKMHPDNVAECCQAENCEIINITDTDFLLETTFISRGNDVEFKNLNVETITHEKVQTDMEKECRVHDKDIAFKTDVPTKVFTEEATHSLRDDVTPSTSEAQVSLSTQTSTPTSEVTKDEADVDSPRPRVLSWNPESCFRLEDIQDQELKLLLEKAGVSKEEFEDRETRDFIYDFIQQHGGKQAVKKDALLLADVSASPLRRLRRSKKNQEGCKQNRLFVYNLPEENEEIQKVGDVNNESSDGDDDKMSTYL